MRVGTHVGYGMAVADRTSYPLVAGPYSFNKYRRATPVFLVLHVVIHSST